MPPALPSGPVGPQRPLAGGADPADVSGPCLVDVEPRPVPSRQPPCLAQLLVGLRLGSPATFSPLETSVAHVASRRQSLSCGG